MASATGSEHQYFLGRLLSIDRPIRWDRRYQPSPSASNIENPLIMEQEERIPTPTDTGFLCKIGKENPGIR